MHALFCWSSVVATSPGAPCAGPAEGATRRPRRQPITAALQCLLVNLNQAFANRHSNFCFSSGNFEISIRLAHPTSVRSSPWVVYSRNRIFSFMCPDLCQRRCTLIDRSRPAVNDSSVLSTLSVESAETGPLGARCRIAPSFRCCLRARLVGSYIHQFISRQKLLRELVPHKPVVGQK